MATMGSKYAEDVIEMSIGYLDSINEAKLLQSLTKTKWLDPRVVGNANKLVNHSWPFVELLIVLCPRCVKHYC